MTFSRGEAMVALEALLHESTAPDGFRLLTMRGEGPDVLVLFRWRRNPHTFGIVLPWSGTVGLSTGDPVSSVEEWAFDAWLYLTEELDTGYLRRALRRQEAGYIRLCDQVYEFDRRYYVSDVPGDGDGLAHNGWNVETARQLRDSGQLIAWLQSLRDRRRGSSVVGLAVVARESSGDAELVVLNVAAGVPETVSQSLAWEALHEAGDDGALRMRVSPTHSRLLTAMGLTASSDDGQWIDTSGLQPNT